MVIVLNHLEGPKIIILYNLISYSEAKILIASEMGFEKCSASNSAGPVFG